VSPPLAFLDEIFAQTRNGLQLNPDLIQDLSPHALQTITAREGYTLSILCQTISASVAITTQLDTVISQHAEIRKEHQELRWFPPDVLFRVANESATLQDMCSLQSALYNLSRLATALALSTCPTAPSALPQCIPA